MKFIEPYKLYCGLRPIHFKSLNKFNVFLELDFSWNWQVLYKLSPHFKPTLKTFTELWQAT